MTSSATSDIRILERIGDRVVLSVSWKTYQSRFEKTPYIESEEYLSDPGELFMSGEELIADLRKHRK
jgi:hypothetical protein